MRRRRREYSVYIMANLARTLYVGVTDNLERRVYEHKTKAIPGFTSREKQIKGWLRSKKIVLIESANPEWNDLSVT